MKLEHVNVKMLASMSKEGIDTLTFIQSYLDWKSNYEFKYDERDKCYWIARTSSLKFDTLEEAEQFAFLNWCDTHPIQRFGQ